MADSWLSYSNQGATRNRPLSERLIDALSYLPDMGVQMLVFSGGQPDRSEGGARVGSVRHDHGDAADAYFYKDGHQLNWANPQDRGVFEQIVQQGKAAGITGFGAGPGYMRPGSMHIGFGTPAVWGAGGKSANAPSWLKDAYYGAPKYVPPRDIPAQRAQSSISSYLSPPKSSGGGSGGGGSSISAYLPTLYRSGDYVYQRDGTRVGQLIPSLRGSSARGGGGGGTQSFSSGGGHRYNSETGSWERA